MKIRRGRTQAESSSASLTAAGKEAAVMSTILVVDDETNICKLLEKELSEEGYRVLSTPDGGRAVELVRKNGIDLVVLDIRMEGQSGMETLSQLILEKKTLPVILHTGYAEYKMDFSTWMASAYVMKSSDLSELKKTIRGLLS
jgi:DNA-binding response OmpR family regulator